MASLLRNACIAALVTAVLTAPVLGLQLVREGPRTVLETHWSLVLGAAAAVFVIQLLRPLLGKLTALRLPGSERLKFDHGSSRSRLLLMTALILLAVAWPFFGTRNQVDIATVVLIYVSN